MADKNFILFDDDCRDHLLPLTFTRPVCEIRIGILTIREKWHRSLNSGSSYLTQGYLRSKYPLELKEINWLINGSALPDPRLVAQVLALQPGEAILENDLLVAACTDQFFEEDDKLDILRLIGRSKIITPATPARFIRKLTDIFTKNGEALRDDYKLITYQRRSSTIFESNKIINSCLLYTSDAADE